MLQKSKLVNYSIDTWQIVVITQIRLPRILLAAITGASLAASGTVFQSVFQNPLAEPYLLGVSSGASLGAALAIILGINIFFKSIGIITLFAFSGSILSIGIVLIIGQKEGKNLVNLLLGGIAIGYICQAIVSFLMIANREKMDKIIFWNLGSFNAANWTKVAISAAIVLPGIILIYLNSEKLNILSLGAEEAHSMGVNPKKTGYLFLGISCLLTATVVSTAGVIGFVGLVVPHMARSKTGANNKKLIPAASLGGACLLLSSDIIARTLIAPSEIPIGVITAFIGGPFLLYILKKNKGIFI